MTKHGEEALEAKVDGRVATDATDDIVGSDAEVAAFFDESGDRP